MTPERAKELIPVLQAVADRKDVEYYNQETREWDIIVRAELLGEYIGFEYKLRVKPEPKLIPFDYSDDLVGKAVIDKRLQLKNLIVSQSERGVSLVLGMYTTDGFLNYTTLLEEKVFSDGSPCGKEMAE